MLEEAIAVIRLLWQGGLQSHHGEYYTVENAQLYTLPEHLPPILIAASGKRTAQMAGRLGDGLITVGIEGTLVDQFRAMGGATKPRYAEINVCWAAEEAQARRLAHERWPIAGLQGALVSDLTLPSHFAQAARLVTEDHFVRPHALRRPVPLLTVSILGAFWGASMRTPFMNAPLSIREGQRPCAGAHDRFQPQGSYAGSGYRPQVV